MQRHQRHRIDWLVMKWMRLVLRTPLQLETFSLELSTRLPSGLLDSRRSLPATTSPVTVVQVHHCIVSSPTLFSARQHAERAICYRESVCPSVCLVCLSHRRISRKRLKLGSWNFHHTVAPSLSCLRCKFHPEIPTGSPERGRQTRVGWGNELILSVSNAFARWQHKLDC